MKKSLSLITFISLILGAIFGLILKENILKIEFLGTFYIKLLKYLILPVIFTSITSSIYTSRSYQGKLVFKTILLFILMFVCSFIISSIVIFIIDPTKGFLFTNIDSDINTNNIDATSVLFNILPKDIIGIIEGKYLLFIIIVSYITGYLSSLLKLDKFINGINKIKEYLFKFLEYLTYYAPIAVFSLIGVSVYKFGINSLLTGLRYILSAYIAGIIVLIVVLILPLKIKGINLINYLKKIYSLWLITISTCSSAASLPYTLKLCKDDLKLNEEISDVVVPLGCTINMCGGAVSFSLLAIFCAKLFGIEITFNLYLMMLLNATLLNMAAPGIPGGGIVIGATYLQGLGIPLQFIGLYSGIYKVLDMLYTSINVTGDVSATVLLNKESI